MLYLSHITTAPQQITANQTCDWYSGLTKLPPSTDWGKGNSLKDKKDCITDSTNAQKDFAGTILSNNWSGFHCIGISGG